MDDDRSWLKNPILPRPPAVPRFSAAELRSLEEDDRPSSVMRVARKDRSLRIEDRRPRASGSSATRALDTDIELSLDTELASEAPRRIA
jgi:hypothetical protein